MKLVILSISPLVLGFMLDQIFGDPQWIYHPVRIIGNFINIIEKILRRIFPANPRGEIRAGAVLAALVPLLTLFAVDAALIFAASINPWVWFSAQSILCYFLLATKSLKTESMCVHKELINSDIPNARIALSRIVGRDTTNLDESGIVRGAVETVAENTADGVIAPMFYFALGGAPLGWCYKAINTLDSMVGYKNTRYLYFGKISAKFDDVVNFIPARLSAILMILASKIAGYNCKNAKFIWLRDNKNHASPNSAQTESVCAGALDIQLAGDAVYSGIVYKKPTIGDNNKQPSADDIIKANKLMKATAYLGLVFLCIIRILVIYISLKRSFN